MFKDLKITYQTGKENNLLVPLLILKNSMKAMEILLDENIRKCAGIKPEHRFMFPSRLGSGSNCSGWHAVNKVCRAVGIANLAKLTATKMRHPASTLYAIMDLPEKDRHYFYKHMGHSK